MSTWRLKFCYFSRYFLITALVTGSRLASWPAQTDSFLYLCLSWLCRLISCGNKYRNISHSTSERELCAIFTTLKRFLALRLQSKYRYDDSPCNHANLWPSRLWIVTCVYFTASCNRSWFWSAFHAVAALYQCTGTALGSKVQYLFSNLIREFGAKCEWYSRRLEYFTVLVMPHSRLRVLINR